MMLIRSWEIPPFSIYRSLFSWEKNIYTAHLLRLGPDDRRLRFMGAVPDRIIAEHAHAAVASDHSKVIGWFRHGVLRGAVELSWNDSRTAEASFSLEAPYRGRNIGRGLARRAIRAARNRAIREIVVFMDAGNQAMYRLGARSGARFERHGHDVEGHIDVAGADAISIISELIEEPGSMTRTTLRWLTISAKRPFRGA